MCLCVPCSSQFTSAGKGKSFDKGSAKGNSFDKGSAKGKSKGKGKFGKGKGKVVAKARSPCARFASLPDSGFEVLRLTS